MAIVKEIKKQQKQEEYHLSIFRLGRDVTYLTSFIVLILLRSVCFNVKYFQENIFQFYSVCFTVKYLAKVKYFQPTKSI